MQKCRRYHILHSRFKFQQNVRNHTSTFESYTRTSAGHQYSSTLHHAPRASSCCSHLERRRAPFAYPSVFDFSVHYHTSNFWVQIKTAYVDDARHGFITRKDDSLDATHTVMRRLDTRLRDLKGKTTYVATKHTYLVILFSTG